MADPTVSGDADVPVNSDAPIPDELLETFWRYERALMADDVPTLDSLFEDSPYTLRGDAGGLLISHHAIAAFRRGRGGAPRRRVDSVHIRVLSPDLATIIAVLRPAAGGRGQQTQVWRRGPDGWRVLAAHVSGVTPAVDSRVWRLVGTPLVESTGDGELIGETLAVKDLFDIAGQKVGGGVPAYLAAAAPAARTAPAVAALLSAGAVVTGIARTDEFAYSIAGVNPHYGTPPNAAVPGAIPGGSSSGPASAVALGQATIGLATDTAGSIRVPASYQGLWGLRTTHGVIPVAGLLPLAPSFDTVGWLTRDLATLRRVAGVALPPDSASLPTGVAVAPALLATLDEEVRAAFWTGLDELVQNGRLPDPVEVPLLDVAETFSAFRTVQAAEAWRAHGPWLAEHPGAVSGAVASRFALAAAVTEEQESAARVILAAERAKLRALLSTHTLLLPAAASAAPQTTADPAVIDRIRAQTLQLTCFAGVAGAPGLSAPLLTVDGAPLGLGILSPPGSDLALLDFAGTLL